MTAHLDPTHIVGIGASAGGLAALGEFFKAMPADSGMAFVVVQLLSPDFAGLMDDLLARHTSMPIQRVENGMTLTANAIHLIPPRQVMTVTEGRLHLQERTGQHQNLPIDTLFESLAGAAQHKAIGIILAGAGSDGARGIQAIHAAGGLVLVQSMESAQFDGMPRAAINTGMYDCIATPAAMPALLLEYAKDPGSVRASADDSILGWGEGEQAQSLRSDDTADTTRNVQSMAAERDRLAERLQLATRAAGIGIWDWDIQHNEIVWDDQMYVLYGLQPGEFGGAYAAWLQGVHPDDRARSDEISARAVRGEAEYDTEFRVLWPDRSVHWLKATGVVFRDRAGRPVRMVGVNYDITERKETEQELKRWADIFQNVTFGFVVGSPDDPFLGIMNPAFARMHGYTMDELTGKPIEIVFAPEDRTELREHIRLTHEIGHHAWEAGHLRKDGTVFPVIVNAVAVKDEAGKVLYRIVTVQDISDRKQAAATRDRLAERLNLATHSAQIGIWDWDIQQDKLVWDDQMYALYGIQPGEFGGAYEAWLNGVHPDDRERTNDVTARAVEGEVTYDTEFRVLWPDGSVHWLKADGEVFHDLDGKPTRMVGANYDITERKELEDSLRDSERRYALLFEKSTVPTVLLKLPEVVIANVNEACEKLTGFTRAEMIGKTSVELGLARKEAREEIIADFRQMGALAENEIPLFTKDGELRIVIANTMPVKMSEGMYAITTMQDITSRKQAEESVRIALAKYQTLFDTFPLGITVSDAAGNIIETNRIAEELLGIGEEEQQQRKIDDVEGRIIRPDATPMPAEEYASVRALKAAKRVENVEMGIVKPDGEITWINVTAVPLPVEGYGVVVAYSDITERKRVEDELRRSNAELEQFAYIASHDLQEPLRTVAGMVQLLQQRYQSQLDERADEYIHFAVDAADRMQHLINDLLDFSRVDRKKASFAATDMDHVLRAALSNLQNAITESGAQITCDPLPTVQAEAAQMTQLLQNLIGNAIKFRGVQPLAIHISAEKIENGWQFAVRDNGIGIDPQYFERIFLIFQRLHTRRKYSGTGIGLAICRKIIERHGGKIWVESQPNHGATFYFTLPERSQT